MKKNKMLRLASALLILVMLTTSIVGGTFAKYTTTGTASDTARVAKWGVTIGAHTDLFAEAYKDEKVGTTDAATATVKTSDTDKLVAPGTTGTGLDVLSTGTPEVSYNMTIKLDDNSKVPSLKYTPNGSAETPYEPLKFTVTSTVDGTTKKIKENLSLGELKGLFNGTNIIYKYDVADGKYYVDENGDGTLETTALATCPKIQITWKWAFETGTGDEVKLNNELDAILGDKASGTNSTNYSGGTISSINTDVALNWTITATQID